MPDPLKFVKNGRNALELLEDLPLTVARVWRFSFLHASDRSWPFRSGHSRVLSVMFSSRQRCLSWCEALGLHKARFTLTFRKLFRSREQTHFKTTKHMITRLIIQSIETGTVTALVMILMVICYETMGAKNLVYVVWCAILLQKLSASSRSLQGIVRGASVHFGPTSFR